MKYMGGKTRIAKHILPIILKNRTENQYFIDIFVGGGNILDKVNNPRIANDSNYYLISMWKALQSGWLPPFTVSEEEYKNIRKNTNSYPPELVCFVGFCCSYAAKWWGGYARTVDKNIDLSTCNRKQKIRNYAKESYDHLVRQQQNIKDVIFYNLDYQEVPIPNNSIIYTDPPYENTTKYKSKFSPVEFWDWCRQKVKEGHKVFISEYNAPDDFVCVWQKEIVSSLTKDTGAKRGIEKLFVHKDQL